MKKIIPAALFILVSMLSCSSADRKIPYEKRLIIAVGDFQNHSGDMLYDQLMYSPTGNFIFELNRYGVFRIIERERLSSILKEYKLSMAGLVDPAKGKEVGKILGVDAILYINLASVQHKVDEKKFNSNELAQRAESKKMADIDVVSANEELTVIVDARLVSVSTGEILAAAKYIGKVENAYSAISGMASRGAKLDKKETVRKVLDESAYKLAKDISTEAEKNYYDVKK